MIEYIAVAEFHETEGSKSVYQFPERANFVSAALEAYILPEGLHKFTDDSSIALFRRKKTFDTLQSHPK
jgi:hypothetical protein